MLCPGAAGGVLLTGQVQLNPEGGQISGQVGRKGAPGGRSMGLCQDFLRPCMVAGCQPELR